MFHQDVAKVPNCEQVKAEHLNTGGIARIIKFPTWEWEAINMDFLVCLPKSLRQHESIWVVVERMTISANFILMKSTYRDKDYVRLYIYEIVRWHWIPLSIISNRGAQFT